MPTTKDILSVTTDSIADFIRKQADARTLSRLVRRLNAELLDGDEAARDLAAAALRHLGFVDQLRP
ncbi:hypothetical protein [Roseicyclus persicicus]|uniref:Addiction module antidote protein n=1 Tax=Roseicyclus persicicus TaxID=2650661 RepID=A0A7X6JXJ7_9RHOB|nr:hypothetical protein [Roseibacterium persicicum]NKX43150.1 hypothetical protein [Roseibacterium persicicum]